MRLLWTDSLQRYNKLKREMRKRDRLINEVCVPVSEFKLVSHPHKLIVVLLLNITSILLRLTWMNRRYNLQDTTHTLLLIIRQNPSVCNHCTVDPISDRCCLWDSMPLKLFCLCSQSTSYHRSNQKKKFVFVKMAA